jgi:hypothetical protein
MPKPHGTKLESLALRLANGQSLRAAAKSVGLARSTARRYSIESSFQALVTRLRERIITRACGLYARAAVKGAQRIIRLADDPDKDIALKAIALINDALLALQERIDISARLDSIEERVERRHGTRD